MTRAWVALGSNLDEPQKQVKAGLQALTTLHDTSRVRTSGLYRSSPWGMTDQPDFINAVACLETGLEPLVLLHALQKMENAHGRRRDGPRWGPRTLDLDLLMYGQSVLHTDELELPHPRMSTRAFVLVPLAELAPELQIPGHGSVQALLQQLGPHDCHLVE